MTFPIDTQPTGQLPPPRHDGRHLRYYLKDHNIPVHQLAKLMGKTPPRVSLYFREKRLSAPIRQQMVAALAVSHQALFGHEVSLSHQGQQLKAYLDSQGLTQAWLAKQLGRQKSSLTNYLKSWVLSEEVRQAILSALGVEARVVFGEQEEARQASVAGAVNQTEMERPASAVRSLVTRQLAEWRVLRVELVEELAFCQDQIRHLEQSLSERRPGEVITGANPSLNQPNRSGTL